MSTVDSGMIGKYVLNFFESFLRLAKQKLSETDKGNRSHLINTDFNIEWFDIWIDEYLKALRSP